MSEPGAAPAFTHVVFDLDGTLLDTLADLALAAGLALGEMCLPPPPAEQVRAAVGHGPVALMRSLLPEERRGAAGLQTALALFQKHYDTCCLQNTRPYPGVPRLLAALKGEGVAMAVLSNKPQAFVGRMAAHFFPGLLDEALGFREGVPPKPDPATVHRLLAGWRAAPARCLYVGDMAVDLETAANAGLHGAGVRWGFAGPALRASPGSTLVSTPAELFTLIEEGPHG